MKITILAYVNKISTGIPTYCTNVTRELAKIDGNLDIKHIYGEEIKIMGRSVGGILVPLFKANTLPIKNSNIVHSMDIHLIHPKTNILTLIDIIPWQYPEDCQVGRIRKFIFEVLAKRMKRMKKIITLTDNVADKASEYFNVDREKFIGIHCGINHDVFYPSDNKPLEISDTKYNLLFVGDIRERKNLHLILEAMAFLGDDYKLIRIGPDRMPYYKHRCLEIVKKHKLDYTDLGYIPLGKLRDYYTHADAYVFPSSDEGFGLPLIEAMSCGTTCVASNIPVFREFCGNKVYYTELNAEDLADKIEHAIKHPKSKDELINYAKRFTWTNTAKKI